MMGTTRILSLQPYFGGSHKAFMETWSRHSGYQFQTISLPPRHWKWRMRHAAWTMAEEANRLWDSGDRWQVNFCTDMLNLAEFKGLVRPEVAALPTVIYFHENQFEYPNQESSQRDLHFGITNFSSALAADLVVFNSEFNRDSMFAHLERLCRRWPDFAPHQAVSSLRDRAQVIHPGVEEPLKKRSAQLPTKVLHLVWAARWEHDKGPSELLELLSDLERARIPFQVSVIGQSFHRVPKAIKRIKVRFADQIIHWGYQDCREDYWAALASADAFVSTAAHEFYGLSASEAISCGLFPILPNRLAYPELLSKISAEQQAHFLYDNLSDAIEKIGRVRSRWSEFLALGLADSFQSLMGAHIQADELDRLIQTALRRA